VTFLQRVLKLQAALWALAGVALAVAPGPVLEGVLDQPPISERAWVRVAGVCAVVLAMLMVLVGQRVADVWWWAWSFALLEAGVATVFALKAAFRLVPGASAWSWWALAGVSAAFGALDLAGLARASREKPFVP